MTKPLTFGSLFAGIGGFDLGLERAGMVCKWQVEINPFCRKVLRKHWPRVRRCKDVKTFPPEGGSWEVDVICGGFPCQDLSYAGKGAGIKDGTRSGLWSEYARIVRLLRPKYVVVENVAALLNRGMGRVLGDLAACGYDCEWDCVPASAVGAPHRRDRVWIVAYPAGAGRQTQRGERAEPNRPGAAVATGSRDILLAHPERQRRESGDRRPKPSRDFNPDGEGEEAQGRGRLSDQTTRTGNIRRNSVCHSAGEGSQVGKSGPPDFPTPNQLERSSWWAVEPDVGRVAHGVPGRVDRITALGNAVVPQVVEFVGRCVVRHHQETKGGG